ncbi:MAG: Asp-tRNA(Asn)/Glu-tRNA(Gln) amidotransferase GatCAB subunit C [Candidatus Nealsonbacteria bacterium CG_4_9_14_3_um_filter_35_11]|uniref:Aspartyl/glutamyl-tRNA(Asn/Gln) amidotransferase subunit C n=2 Tax=Candidatus Nealsoniibacteriota TaxID=1817911 RepID=A0A2M7DB97_9BACT|nr:MAG: Asp-tRNA(Asn)/Glu-tRNA(Gln) amidotransferase GatCAB subunit C [Candidatus Nealsonbacteria bacterium CG11_big_fil_rev_8_21_14_0_20_35_11]PIV45731.1 MAG: Asp-tRNA(Asn)/Glu-tRNA(Gln) amidotransferase GatCAB subunit C [Candidatus Nealsonbacteria bacterium CG02_land_8_20_14_3_00_34_20]PIW92639.1 MAG: Asp-tRNA(Asn)/Glu-tRNA(Gln) amidotransferase GatCAB subunit C [Candidatus Nealsonbacteria bacterium CG_4_8_14_3_um_filter_34_13]PIZ90097.1 MAG: Asp-tRNA(Asn)/Glu-tRNA(Gln) amidotransferase GatCAB
MVSKETVIHIAKLARLKFSENETEKFQGEFSSILDYVENLKVVDVSGVEPTSHSMALENIEREDYLISYSKDKLSKKLLDLAPETKNGYLKVKSVF